MNVKIPNTATPVEMPAATRRRVTEIFTREEIRQLTARSNLMGFIAVGFTWGIITLTFAVLAWASRQPLMVAAPVFFVGFIAMAGRHLGLAILMHEAAHKTLFKSPWLNDVLTDWLCARPIWNDLKKYRAHHFVHHTHTGQAEDTDLSLVAPFPVTRASLWRKLARDALGLTGLKYFLGRILMDAGVIRWTVASDVVKLPQKGRQWWMYPRDFMLNSAGMLLTNGLLFALLWWCGYPALYVVWVLSYVTPFPLFLRIRSLAEHACTEQSADMFRNTRTTHAGWLARATVAPIRVNYHIEHHVMASVPYFQLPIMHRMLRERGAVGAPPGYWDVLRIVSSQ